MRTMMRARQTHKRKFLALFFIFFVAQKSFKQQKRNQWILKFCVVVHWFVLCFFDLALLSVDLFIFPYLPKNSFPVHCPQAICTLLSPCIRRCCFQWVFISLAQSIGRGAMIAISAHSAIFAAFFTMYFFLSLLSLGGFFLFRFFFRFWSKFRTAR